MGFSGGTYTRTTQSGTYTGANVWADSRDADIKILAADHDEHDQDIATGLSTCITKDGQTTITANLPMAGFRHTNVGASAARTDYAQAAQVQDGAYIWGGADGGVADAYTITLSPAITAYAAGQTFRFIPQNDNTGASTLAVNGLTAQDIKKGAGTTDPAAGDILASSICEVTYDGTNFYLINNLGTIATTDIVDDAITADKIGTLDGDLVFNDAFDSFRLAVTAGVTATGTTQGTAGALTTTVTEFTTVTGGGRTAILPAATSHIGKLFIVANHDNDTTMWIYPAVGEAIGDNATNANINLAVGNTVIFVGLTASRWGVVQA